MVVEKNFIDSGDNRRAKLDVWQGLDKLGPYFRGLQLDESQKQGFKQLVHQWGKDYIKAFGEHQVTHYIVS